MENGEIATESGASSPGLRGAPGGGDLSASDERRHEQHAAIRHVTVCGWAYMRPAGRLETERASAELTDRDAPP
eukprot:scaffold1658_cov115-Isochrysis_galbana.AAC.8